MAKLIELGGSACGAYSDGEIESIVLEELRAGRSERDILLSRDEWPVLYHFSPQRRNILSWYEFECGASILEIGAGWGALTGLFIERELQVDCVELSKARAQIIEARYPSSKAQIFAGNISDIEFEREYDYATLIGVLEYAGAYGAGADPYAALLSKACAALRQGGVLFLAIENPFGIKYWAGAAEDHCGIPYASIEGYRRGEAARTFTLKTLLKMLKSAGFLGTDVYFAMPDYKMPERIVSAESPQYFGLAAVNSGSYEREEYRVFDEKAALVSLIAAENFGLFANSFLICAQK